MHKINSKNELIKHKYLDYMEEAKGYATSTIDCGLAAITMFEEFNQYADFRLFNKEVAKEYKKYVCGLKSKKSPEKLGLGVIKRNLRSIQEFLRWLSQQPGYRSKILLSDIEYLNLSEAERRIASSIHYKPIMTLEQLEKAILAMPHSTEIELRDRAILCFLMLTACRIGALISLRLKHFHPNINLVDQDPREVTTKRRKHITTYFNPVSDIIIGIFKDYYNFLRVNKLFGPNDALFPRTLLVNEGRKFKANGLSRECWKNTNKAREVVKGAFSKVQLPAYTPHSIRHMWIHWLSEQNLSGHEEKVFSVNFGHKHLSTTLNNYYSVDVHTQGKVMEGLKKKKEMGNKSRLSKELVALLEKNGLLEAN